MLLNIIFPILAITAETTGSPFASTARWKRHYLSSLLLVICYGTLMSFPSWNFSRTWGFIALFFIISQIVAVVMMRERIALPVVMLGGLLIVTGGLIILL